MSLLNVRLHMDFRLLLNNSFLKNLPTIVESIAQQIRACSLLNTPAVVLIKAYC